MNKRVPTTYEYCERMLRKHFENKQGQLHICGGDGGDAQHYLLEIEGIKLWFSNHGYLTSYDGKVNINLHHGYNRGNWLDELYQPEVEVENA